MKFALVLTGAVVLFCGAILIVVHLFLSKKKYYSEELDKILTKLEALCEILGAVLVVLGALINTGST